MKITKVEAFHVDWGAGRGRSAWVRLGTDDGVWGLGEASPMVHGNASLEIVASAFTPMLLGADPLQPRVVQDRLFHQHIKLGPEGAYTGALAAIDIALWDLRGKALGQPVWKLLGGAWRRELPFYASIGGNGQRSVDEVCRVVEDWLRVGPAQVKIRFDADKTTRDVDLAGDIAKARAVRKLVGDDFPLAFDSNNGYSVQGAIRVGRALEELGYVWFEEPVQHYHVESFAKVAAALDIAVAAGEQSTRCRASSGSSKRAWTSCSPTSSRPAASPPSATWRRWPGPMASTWSRPRRSRRSATPPTCTSWRR